MIAEVICIGTELLLGDVVNTNASYFGKELSKIGIDLYYIITVGDNKNRIISAFDIATKRADIIITTGGLGPTPDDLTHEAVAEFFNLELVLYEEILNQLKTRFEKRGLKILGSNEKQAFLPKYSKIIYNDSGTAPGIILERNNKIFLTFPGVPSELKDMWEKQAKNYLISIKKDKKILFSRVLKFTGIRESELSEIVRDLLDLKNPTVAPLIKNTDVTLRITAKAESIEDAEMIVKPIEEEILKRAGKYYYGKDDETLESILNKILKEKCIKNIYVDDKYSNGKLFESLNIDLIFLDRNSNKEELLKKNKEFIIIEISEKSINNDISFSINYNNKKISKNLNYSYFKDEFIFQNFSNQLLNNLRILLTEQ